MRRDACPGALQVHEAADGALARVRVPGGRLAPSQLAVIADCAESLGSGVIELTSRANLQVRGLPTPPGPAPHGPGSATGGPGSATGGPGSATGEPGSAGGFAARVAEAGLLPSPSHERVRNIVASPYDGRGPAGRVDVAPLVEALDRALCAEPRLAGLPGRFLFAVDDGSGDVAGLNADVTWTPDTLLIAGTPANLPGSDLGTSLGSHGALPRPADSPADSPTHSPADPSTDSSSGSPADPPTGTSSGSPADPPAGSAMDSHGTSPLGSSAGSPLPPSPDAVAAVMVAAALAFLAERGTNTAWRIGELADGPARIAARLGGTLRTQDGGPLGASAVPRPAGGSAAVRRAARVTQRDGRVALEVLVPLGRLSPQQARALAEAAERADGGAERAGRGAERAEGGAERGGGAVVVVTPWRSVVLLDLAASAAAEVAGWLAEEGLVTDPESPWTGVTACTGRPGCAKSLADVRADAARWVAERAAPPESPVHWSGCERRCGRPRGRVEDRVATGVGYVTGPRSDEPVDRDSSGRPRRE